MTTREVILVFQKNPELGKVKTRLAVDLGAEKALRIYQFLVQKTHEVLKGLSQEKLIYHSDFLPSEEWSFPQLHKLQRGGDLGEKMKNAFEEAFDLGFEKVVIIGTDCAELTEGILIKAFDALDHADLVIGPAADGGYYLLGMKKKNPGLFDTIAWSTSSVLAQTLEIAQKNTLSFDLLPILHDIDEEKDWIRFKTQNPQYELD
jgi:rSAM/selenodomain-associated transferase 1